MYFSNLVIVQKIYQKFYKVSRQTVYILLTSKHLLTSYKMLLADEAPILNSIDR